MEVVGAAGHLKEGSPGAELAHILESRYRSSWVLTFGGGTNEIQRDIIGMAGLGLPRRKASQRKVSQPRNRPDRKEPRGNKDDGFQS